MEKEDTISICIHMYRYLPHYKTYFRKYNLHTVLAMSNALLMVMQW